MAFGPGGAPKNTGLRPPPRCPPPRTGLRPQECWKEVVWVWTDTGANFCVRGPKVPQCTVDSKAAEAFCVAAPIHR